MYMFDIVFTRGTILNETIGELPDVINGKGLIIIALLLALYAAILNYLRKKKQINE